MRVAVVDTCALLRVFIPDGPIPDGLEALLDEATQVLRKKEAAGLLQAAEADEILATLLELPYEVLPCRGFLVDALEVGRRLGVTVYDGLFLALARQRRAELFTADAELKRAWRKLQGK